MNIRVDFNYPISDGTEVVFRSPVDCSQVTGLKVYYDGGAGSQEFAFADAHGNNVGDIDHLFAENVVVKVILDVTTGMAFVQNADTNAYLESRFDGIIDKLCPSFTEKGTVVTCEPVEGYPLEVVSMIAPFQSGSGDPSPNNIRPITGRTAGKLWRGGRNLIDPAAYIKGTRSTLNGDVITTNFKGGWLYINAIDGYIKTHPKGTYTATFFPLTEGAACSFFVYSAATKAELKAKYSVTAGNPSFTFTADEEFYLSVGGCEPFGEYAYRLQLEAGTVSTAYEPYRGEEFTLDLGQTVYGGSLDWATGVLTLDRYCRTFTGEEAWFWTGDANNNYNANYRPLLYITDSALFAKDRSVPCLCSHFKYETLVAINGGTNIGCYVNNNLIGIRPGLGAQVTTIEAWKGWLAAQSAAGTPVQLCYELANPITVRLTPQEILALSGTNCLYSGTGDTQVTGRADIGRYIDKKFAELASAIVNNT